MKKIMFAAAFLAFTGITALNAKDYNYNAKAGSVTLQDTTGKDTVKTDTTTTTTTTDTTGSKKKDK